MELITPLRGLADEPISYDKDDYDNPVATALDGHLATLNSDTSTAADLEKELKDVIAEAVEEVGKLAAAEERFKEAQMAYEDADGDEAIRKAAKELKDARDAKNAAEAEFERRQTELLAKLADILERAGLLGGGEGGDGDPTKDTDWRDQQEGDPEPRKASPETPASTSPRSSDTVGDSEPSVTPAPGSTDLSTSTAPAQQSAYPQIQVPTTPQQQMPTASPSAAMPNITPSPSSSLRTSPKGKDKRQDSSIDTDRGVLPVATPVPAAVPIDRGSSSTGVTTRDVSGKPSTSLSTSGQVPGSANASNPRGGGGFMGGAPMGGAGQPLGAGNKSTTASKIIDRDATLTRRGDDDMSTSGGSLSRDSLEKLDKAESDEEDRIAKAIREQRSKGKSTG